MILAALSQNDLLGTLWLTIDGILKRLLYYLLAPVSKYSENVQKNV